MRNKKKYLDKNMESFENSWQWKKEIEAIVDILRDSIVSQL